MRKNVVIGRLFCFIVMVVSLSGCCPEDCVITESLAKNLPGEGTSWTFNVTNQSGSSITLKATPLRGNEYAKAEEGAQFIDGPTDEKSLASGTSTTLVLRTGTATPALSPLVVLRSFTFEIAGLGDKSVIFYGWPQKEGASASINAQYYGLGYIGLSNITATSLGNRLFSSLAPGYYLESEPIYNVIIKDTNTIEWLLDEKVKLCPLSGEPCKP
jgi:hypothetical protein